MSEPKTYQESLDTFVPEKEEPIWLQEIRRRAYERFRELGFPTRRHEAWKYMSLSRILRSSFQSAAQPSGLSLPSSSIQDYALSPGEIRRVWMNGFSASQFQQGEIPGGRVKELSKAIAEDEEALQPLIGAGIETEENVFSAINTFSFSEGLYLHVPDETVIRDPIHLLFLGADQDASAPVFYPRLIFVLGRGAKAEIILHHASETSQPYLLNSVAEIYLRENARLQCIALHRGAPESFHLFSGNARLSEGSSLETVAFADGGAQVRHEIQVHFDGPQASASVNGLGVLSGHSHFFQHIKVEHRAPHGTSRQLCKNILADQSQAEFNSLVYVHRGAVQSDSLQMNRNLLLSEDARVYSRPQLKIYTDDVRANHGAANGQLERGELFYLASRGLDKQLARLILAYGFADEVLEKVKSPEVRSRIEAWVRAGLDEMIKKSTVAGIV